jgi:hypothetical protein
VNLRWARKQQQSKVNKIHRTNTACTSARPFKKLKQALPNLDINGGGESETKPPAKAEPKEEKKEKPN